MGYCPFSSPGRDTVGCVATGKGWADSWHAWPGARPSRYAHDSGSTHVRQRSARGQHGFLAERSRHQILCRDIAKVEPGWSWVVTPFLGRDRELGC